MISLMKIDYIYGYSYALVKNNKRTQCPNYARNSLSRSINIWEVNLKGATKEQVFNISTEYDSDAIFSNIITFEDEYLDNFDALRDLLNEKIPEEFL